jgi:hypothetical protein
MITKWINAYKRKNQGYLTPIFVPTTKRELLISGKELIREKSWGELVDVTITRPKSTIPCFSGKGCLPL